MRSEDEIQQPGDGKKRRQGGEVLGRPMAPRSPRYPPVQHEQRKPQQKKIQGGDSGNQTWVNTDEGVRGGFAEQQLIDAQVPASDVLNQAEQAHQSNEGGHEVAAKRSRPVARV